LTFDRRNLTIDLMPNSVRSLELVVRRRKTTHYPLPTTNFKVKLGFTLIELLIVISIIAILVASATYSWQNAQQKGRDGKRKSDIKAVQQALEFYYQNNGKYAEEDASTGKIRCDAASPPIDWGSSFTCGTTSFMQQLPKDPISTNSYYYEVTTRDPNNNNNPINYKLSALIENNNDPEKNINCGPNGRNFCVYNP